MVAISGGEAEFGGVHQDALTVDLSQATVVTLYLTQEANLSLRRILQKQLRPGARVVSHAHSMGDWVPERVEGIIARSSEEHPVYLWRIRYPDGALDVHP